MNAAGAASGSALAVAHLGGGQPVQVDSPAAGNDSTPASNTGVTVAWAGLHWFAGTLFGADAEATANTIGEVVNTMPVLLERGGFGYTRSYSIAKAKVYFTPGRDDVFVSFPGAFCEQVGIVDLVVIATTLELEPNSRLDVAWDIQGLEPEVFKDAFTDGNVVTRIHRSLNEETGRQKGIESRSNHEGDTVYLGSRHSNRFVRVYNRRGPTRLEMEWKDKRAVALWQRLLAVAEAAWSREAMAELRAFLDFRDRRASVRPDSCPLLDWWAEIVKDAGRSCVTFPRVQKTFEDVQNWVHRQVAPSLALLYDGLNDFSSELKLLIQNGRTRYRAKPEKVALLPDITRAIASEVRLNI